ncbi:MAG: CBS domain-containing protein [Cetobacterium sp.]|uniref:CBS domain-containing protein n=1 Tax=unclassified Cetobacterium TaxID=2630983 RepID=UPI00163BE300|nr:CBS domain-containing protein [Cetobacterium sp. 2A]MBC2856616.1 CBS domain-containing protein [Cetobacterium sp. 2A]
MEVITTHHFSDLDGVASMVIAQKLYPNAKMVIPSTLGTSVQKFLSFFGDLIDFKLLQDIDIKKVHKLILVDTSDGKRIAPFETILDKVELITFDHHIIEKSYGSNTSYLLDILFETYGNDFPLTQWEKDLCLLGIYEDTGNFLYPTTNYKDLEMAGILLKNGANLEIINEFTHLPLSNDQDIILKILLDNLEVLNIKNQIILISTVSSPTFLRGVNEIIDRITSTNKCSACFIIAKSKEKISIIGRSFSPLIKLNIILEDLDGGGHWSAYSAVYPDQNLNEALEFLKVKLYSVIQTENIARDIMSFPVKVVTEDTTLKEAYLLVERTGHSGFPVLKDSKIVGMISRKELAKLVNHGLGNSLVSKYMNKSIITADASTTLTELKDLIVENDLGRIPILEDDNLVGIITKTDLLNAIYNRKYLPTVSKERLELQAFPEKILSNFPNKIKEILAAVEIVSKLRKEKSYLVGGIVRDSILNIPNEDIDIVVSGNGIEFSKDLTSYLKTIKIVTHERFNTATIFLENGLSLDITTLRSEYYEYPTALPTVIKGTIRDDLFRRDFTINALAIELTPNNFGNLLDYFKGYQDIKNKLIRVIHKISFIEDPTRIVRAIRFASRYDFTIEETTEKLIFEAIDLDLLEKISWSRIITEFKYIFEDKNPLQGIYLLNKYNLLPTLNKELILTENINKKLIYFDSIKEKFTNNLQQWICFLLILVSNLESDDLISIFYRFKFNANFRKHNLLGLSDRNKILFNLSFANKNSEIFSILENISGYMLMLLFIEAENKTKDKINLYLFNLRKKIAIIKGEDFLKLGYSSGPELKILLKKAFLIQLDLNLPTKEKIIKELEINC